MTQSAKISEQNQAFSIPEKILLFTVDASNIYYADGTSVGILRFTPGAFGSDVVVFDGNSYVPIEVEAEGFEWNGQGAFPIPKLRISNVTKVVSAAIIGAQHLLGAKVQRIQTFKQYLDLQPEADPSATFIIDEYFIERCSNHTKVFVEWELSSSIDQEGRTLPGRQAFQNLCPFRYRFHDSRTSTFTQGDDNPCPYVGTNYFTSLDAITTDPAKDVCSKRLSGCKLRFPNQPLPFGGHPGMSKV